MKNMQNIKNSVQKALMISSISLLSFIGTSINAAEFTEEDGDKLYHELCASCHMPDGKGAVGAGMYPSLVGNEKLANSAYPKIVVLYGLNGMPALGGVLNDNQIANVINYVRGNFAGYQDDVVTAQEISQLRIPNYEYNDLN